MEYEDRQWKLVAYLSKSFNEIERNYKIHDKEMLAIIRELENWRHLLESTKFKFEVWTDHKNLEYFMKAVKNNLYLPVLFTGSTEDRLDQKIRLEDRSEMILYE